MREDPSCPECGSHNLGSYYYEGGIFRKQVKVNFYVCFKCGCEYETRE